MIRDEKTERKNLWTALGLVIFIVILFVFTLYNVGVFERSI